MSGLATAQTTAPATADLTGYYLYSWRQMQWVLVLGSSRAGNVVTFTVEGQDAPISVPAGDHVQVCIP